MMLATFSDYVGFSILWAIPLLSMFKLVMMLGPISQTLSGRLMDVSDKRDKRLEDKLGHIKDFAKEAVTMQGVKIIEAWNPLYVYAMGFRKQRVMIILPGLDFVDEEALFWVYKQKSYYLIYHAALKVQIIKFLSLAITAFVSNITLGCSFSFSALYALAAGSIVEAIGRHVLENRADDFAIKNASERELQGGLRFLMAASQEQMKEPWLQKIVRLILQPSYTYRINKLRQVLEEPLRSVDEGKVEALRSLFHKNNREEIAFIEAKKQQVLRWIDADED